MHNPFPRKCESAPDAAASVPVHVPESDRREGANARGYTYKWQKASKAFLALNPLCAACQRKGLVVPATEVDHIIPHKGNAERFWDPHNLQSLCHRCHSRKTARESGWARAGVN